MAAGIVPHASHPSSPSPRQQPLLPTQNALPLQHRRQLRYQQRRQHGDLPAPSPSADPMPPPAALRVPILPRRNSQHSHPATSRPLNTTDPAHTSPPTPPPSSSSSSSSADRTPVPVSGPVSFPSTNAPGGPDETVAGPLHAASRKALTLKAAAAPGDITGILQLDIKNLPPTEGVAAWTDRRTPASAHAGTIRKKSGEVVKPSLKSRPASAHPACNWPDSSEDTCLPRSAAPTNGFPKSMPNSPMPKAVHFNRNLEQIKVFSHRSRPSAVSATASPEQTETETETETETGFSYHHFGPLFPSRMARSQSLQNNSGDPLSADGSRALTDKLLSLSTPSRSAAWPNGLVLRLPNFPSSENISADQPVFLEKVVLADDLKTINGTAQVKNISFEKWVAVRFTTDHWTTVNEAGATYLESIKNGQSDRFTFSIRLNELLDWPAGQTKAGVRSMSLCLRYWTPGHEFWDNNQGKNYQLDFHKRPNPSTSSTSLPPLPQGTPASERVPIASACSTAAWGQPMPPRRPAGAPRSWSDQSGFNNALQSFRATKPVAVSTDVAAPEYFFRPVTRGTGRLSLNNFTTGMKSFDSYSATRFGSATSTTRDSTASLGSSFRSTSPPGLDVEAPSGSVNSSPESIPTSFNSVRSWGSRSSSITSPTVRCLPHPDPTTITLVPTMEGYILTSICLLLVICSTQTLPLGLPKPSLVTSDVLSSPCTIKRPSVSATTDTATDPISASAPSSARQPASSSTPSLLSQKEGCVSYTKDPIPPPIQTSEPTLSASANNMERDESSSPSLSTPILSGISSEADTPSLGAGPLSPSQSLLSPGSLDSAWSLSSQNTSPCDVDVSPYRAPWSVSGPLGLESNTPMKPGRISVSPTHTPTGGSPFESPTGSLDSRCTICDEIGEPERRLTPTPSPRLLCPIPIKSGHESSTTSFPFNSAESSPLKLGRPAAQPAYEEGSNNATDSDSSLAGSDSTSQSTSKTPTPTPDDNNNLHPAMALNPDNPALASALAHTGALSLRDLVERFCWNSGSLESATAK